MLQGGEVQEEDRDQDQDHQQQQQQQHLRRFSFQVAGYHQKKGKGKAGRRRKESNVALAKAARQDSVVDVVDRTLHLHGRGSDSGGGSNSGTQAVHATGEAKHEPALPAEAPHAAPPVLQSRPSVTGAEVDLTSADFLQLGDVLIMKKMLNRERTEREVGFYEELCNADEDERQHRHSKFSIEQFVPRYCGVAHIARFDADYLVLEDLTRGMERPCVLDVKLGTRTFEPTAKALKRRKELVKFPLQASLGFRISGMKIFYPAAQRYAVLDQHYGRSLDAYGVLHAFRCFFGGAHIAGGDDKCNLRRDVLAASLREIVRLWMWLQTQRHFLFVATSLLIVYDGAIPGTHQLIDSRAVHANRGKISTRTSTTNGSTNSNHNTNNHNHHNGKPWIPPPRSPISTPICRIKLIDFAHILPANGKTDTSTLRGVSTVAGILQSLLDDYYVYPGDYADPQLLALESLGTRATST